MSRTYRRRKDKAPDWVIRNYVYRTCGSLYYTKISGVEEKREVAKWHSDAGWHNDDYSNCPSWWIHDFMEKPFRAKTKKALRKVLKLADYEDADISIIYKKPYIYYW